MQIVSVDSLQFTYILTYLLTNMSNPVFWENITNLSSAELAQRVVNVKFIKAAQVSTFNETH